MIPTRAVPKEILLSGMVGYRLLFSPYLMHKAKIMATIKAATLIAATISILSHPFLQTFKDCWSIGF